MIMRTAFLFSAILFVLSARAGEGDDSARLASLIHRIDSIESSLHYKTGKIVLPDGLATLNIGPGFRFLEAEDARKVIEDAWGNLKGQTALGMIVPAQAAASLADYAFVVEYQPIGYVKDEDAEKIDYDQVLKDMREDNEKANAQRRSTGITPMHIVGWAETPHYDKNRKILYWAQQISVDGSEENTLNYDIRLLGRKGVMVLTAVSGISQLDTVNRHINEILDMVSFNKGHQYSDFNSSTDQVAAWTIGGLVAGKVLAKVGFFAILLKYLKLIVVGIVAGAGAIWRWITGRKKEDELVPVTEPAPSESVE